MPGRQQGRRNPAAEETGAAGQEAVAAFRRRGVTPYILNR